MMISMTSTPALIFHGGKYYVGNHDEGNNNDEESSVEGLRDYPLISPFWVLDPTDKKLKALPEMRIPRHWTRWESLGKYLYVIGGLHLDNDGLLKDVEAYDPEANTWTTVADMNVAREACHSVTYNGLLYVIDVIFEFGDKNDQASFECYNPTTNKWTLLEPMRSKKFNKNVGIDVVADDGFIIVRVDMKINKHDYSKFYRYNIDRGTWSYDGAYDKMEANLCLVEKHLILPHNSDETGQEERKSLVDRYFEQLSEKEPLWKENMED